MNDYAKQILRKLGGMALFRFVCGDAFVVGYQRGAKFSAIISMASSTTEEQKEDGKHISASQAQSDVQGEEKSYYEKKQANAQLAIEVIRQGLEEDIPVLSLDTLLTDARTFPTKVAASPILPIRTILTSDYVKLLLDGGYGDPGPTPDWAKVLNDNFVYLRRLAQYKGSLIYIREHKDQFVSFDERLLASRIDIAATAMDTLVSWAAECYRTLGKHCIDVQPTKLEIPVYSPLRAQGWLPPDRVDPIKPAPQPVGDTLDTEMTVEARGSWQNGRGSFLPVTSFTSIGMTDKSNAANTREIETQLTQHVSPNSLIYIRFRDNPNEYSDNGVYWPSPASVRLGGAVDNFIKGGP